MKAKVFFTTALLIIIIGNIKAVDIESYQFIDYLRAIAVPGKPQIYEDGVVFTFPSSYQRVGISFAHEGYARVYWFKRLMVPRDPAVPLEPAELAAAGKNQKNPNPNKDSGVMFHIEPIPANLKNMDYRLIIDGLWTTDPLNPLSVTSPSGVVESRVALPEKPDQAVAGTAPGTYRFSYQGPPGETVTVGGSFNHWDPFMYVLRETKPGFYTLSLPLPPGTFQYVFFLRGEQIPDPANPRKLYSRDGRVISEARIP
ncbi:MAG: glycogen-binding domain-containing protein [Treponema sp.]|nr:glycogen-binding domain-containing protein [Treponema sp.]